MNASVKVLFVLLAGIMNAGVHAEKSYIQLLAAADPWPPYIDEQHPKGGVAVEIADAAFRTQGYTVRNRIVPWARALEETKAGRIDLILDAWWSEERSVQLAYSRPYLDGPIKLIKLKSTDFIFENFGSLNGLSVGMVRDYAYGDEFMHGRGFNRVALTDFMQGIRMLALSRIDLAIGNEIVSRFRIKREAPELISKIEFVEPPISNNFIYVIAGRHHPRHVEMISAFNKGLEVIVQSGAYERILKRQNLPVPAIYKNRVVP